MSATKIANISDRMGKIVQEVLIAMMGAAFLSLLSQAAIPLPFTPIPLTLQTLAVFLLGGTLGSSRAVYSILIYLAQGCCGLPVFAGGAVQPLWFLGPQAGFLWSFIPAAYLIGALIEKRPRPPLLYLFFSLLAGQSVISIIGMLWLALYVGLSKAFLFGVLPFLSAAAIKIGAGSLTLKGLSLCKRAT